MQFPIYIGWIYGDPEDRETLKGLGVKGHMLWRASNNSGSLTVGASLKRGIFTHCECAVETLDRLEKMYPVFCRDSFTRTDKKAYREYCRQFKEDK